MNSFIYCYDLETKKELEEKGLRLLKADEAKSEFIFINNPSTKFEAMGKVHISNKLNF